MKEKRNQTLFVMSLYCFYLSFLKNKSLFNIFLTFFSVVRYFSISFIYTFIHLSKKSLTFLNLFLLKKLFLSKNKENNYYFCLFGNCKFITIMFGFYFLFFKLSSFSCCAQKQNIIN